MVDGLVAATARERMPRSTGCRAERASSFSGSFWLAQVLAPQGKDAKRTVADLLA
jgi:hypothetical protein